MRKKVPVCIIGLGRIASLLESDELREKPCTHAGAIKADKNCVLVAGADINAKRRRLFENKWKVPTYSDAELMLCEEQCKILIIATHPDSHAEYCKLAAKYKIRVVICEKPLADSLKNAKQIAKIAGHLLENEKYDAKNPHGMRIIVNHERRYSLDYINARGVLKSKNLGQIKSVRAILYMGSKQRLVDMLWHDGTHLIDAIMFLTGCAIKHKNKWGASLKGKQGTAYLEASLKPQKGGPAIVSGEVPLLIEMGAERDHLVFEIQISLSRGSLRIGNGIYEVYTSKPSPYAEGFKSLQRTKDKFDGRTGYFSNMIRDAVTCVYAHKKQPVSNVQSAMAVIEYLSSVSPL
ncbi:MAG: Gfo/Idh/MocA family oxidoreductase [Termitinemataceae bacterium]|nr:MAG: Gfo/Idh/MocA family oxidoreductase [Termitinemataceae bacterium]